VIVKGLVIDEFTRCVHYHSELDVIAIKFNCCGDFYPCYECHQETAGHEATVWEREAWNEKAILCGRCKNLMTIHEYIGCGYQCPSCKVNFNPKCSNHNHLYFESLTIG
jgi:uncharacterized CHY-type Zn-finger protein